MAEEFEETPEFKSVLDRFKAKLAEFEQVYQVLAGEGAKAAAQDPQLQEEYQALMTRAHQIRAMIRRATDAIDWVRYQLGLASDTVEGMGNLGLFPLLAWGAAIAAMTAAIGAMSYWLSGAYEWSKRAQIAEQIAKAGGSGEEVSRALQSSGGLLGIPGYVWIGGLVLYAAWQYYQGDS